MDKVVEVMRIKRLPPMGKLVVEIGNQRFEKISQLPNDVVRQMAVAAIGELIVFADGYQTLVDAGVAPPMVASISDSDSKIDASISEKQEVFRSAVEDDRLAAIATDRSEGDTGPLDTPEPPKPGTGPLEDDLDIAGQVNIFLQRQVQQIPELRGRSIVIAGDLSGGLSISVDGQSFETPSEIEDPLVRTAIQKALREWETSKEISQQ